MSKTLNLLDILLTTGRQLVTLGRFTEALEPLTKLAGFRSLPAHVLEELHPLLADVYLQQQNYKDARRCLAAAIVLRPLEAHNHYLMAIAIQEDGTADLKRAEMYYDRAVRSEPDNSAYWVDFGSYLFKIGKTKEGLKALRKAYALDTSDGDIVGQVAALLRREGYYEEATTKLRAALFENHGVQRFRLLWQQHQIALLHAEQQKASVEPDPVILPFVAAPTQGKYLEMGRKTFRIDAAESLPEPKEKTPVTYRRPPKG